MRAMNFSAVIEALSAPYTQRWSNSASDARECLALVDLYVRVAWTLTLSESRRRGGNHRPASTPGMGMMLAVVRAAQKDGTFGNGSLGAALKASTANLVKVFDAFRAPSFNSLKEVRDRLDHGEALSTNDAQASDLAESLRRLCAAMKTALTQQLGAFSFSASGEQVLLSGGGTDSLNLVPLWVALDQAPHAGLYGHAGKDELTYLVPGNHQRSSCSIDKMTASDKDWLAVSEKQGALSRFARQVTNDVAAYTEDHTAPDYHFGDDEEAGWLIVPWTRATSDQNQLRLDRFRVSQNDEKQWRDSNNQWRPYTAFLKEISNWPVLARRVGIGLADGSRKRSEEEVARLGTAPTSNVRGPARLREVDSDLKGIPDVSFDLQERIDRACELVKPSTEVFFLVGQAGLGKTELMMSAAQERAKLLAQKPDDSRPLYLFVSSTGRTLASLEDAVNSALNITKLLSSRSARVLCRNGLLVLIVDGFDELLGSSGYENALGSLEPWFRDLGGKGVVVASARSSYYLTQYRRSLANSTGLNVEHTFIELQQWSRAEAETFLDEMGTPASTATGLSERDWRLLGIPFFAKSFAAWRQTHEDLQGNQPLFEIVVGQYLDREASKLKDDHHGAPLLDAAELRSLFAEVAEMMLQRRTRELELPELVQCAQMATNIEDLELHRPGLTNRLSAICAMTVSTSTTKKFSFSHEVMLDCFVTIVLENALRRGGDFSGVRRVLQLTKIQADVFEWLSERCPTETLSCVERLSVVEASPDLSQALCENVGTWWSILLRRRRGVPPSSRASGLRMDKVELSHGDWNNLSLINCEIRELKVPVQGEHSIHVTGTKIGQLNGLVDRIRATVIDASPELVGAVHSGTEWYDTKRAVRTWFVKHGIAKADVAHGDDEAVDAADYFLGKIERFHQVVVTEQGLLSDDNRLSWSQRYGEHVWRAFLDRLIRYELAHWASIQASGQAKQRLVFDVAPARIRQRDADNSKVAGFWAEIESVD
jgi:hypothetical protein